MAITVEIGLTKPQLTKLKRARKEGTPCKLRLSYPQLFESSHKIPVSFQQLKRIESAKKSATKKGLDIILESGQVGGFLTALATQLAPIAFDRLQSDLFKGNWLTGDGIVPMGMSKGNGLFIPGTIPQYRPRPVPPKKKLPPGSIGV